VTAVVAVVGTGVAAIVVAVAVGTVTVKDADAVVALVSPVAMIMCVPAGVAAGTLTVVLKAPLESALVVPRPVGVLCRVRSIVSPASKPDPDTVSVQPVEALHVDALSDSDPVPPVDADALVAEKRTVTNTATKTASPEIFGLVVPPSGARPGISRNKTTAIHSPCDRTCLERPLSTSVAAEPPARS
jgi:hypothetical protein